MALPLGDKKPQQLYVKTALSPQKASISNSKQIQISPHRREEIVQPVVTRREFVIDLSVFIGVYVTRCKIVYQIESQGKPPRSPPRPLFIKMFHVRSRELHRSPVSCGIYLRNGDGLGSR